MVHKKYVNICNRTLYTKSYICINFTKTKDDYKLDVVNFFLADVKNKVLLITQNVFPSTICFT